MGFSIQAKDLLNKKAIDLYEKPSKRSDFVYAIPPGSVVKVGKRVKRGWRLIEVNDGDRVIKGYAPESQLKKNFYRDTVDVKRRNVKLRFRDQVQDSRENHISSRVMLSLMGQFGFAFQASQTIRSVSGAIEVDAFVGSQFGYGIAIDIPVAFYSQVRLLVRRDSTDMSSKSQTAIIGAGEATIDRKQSFLTTGLFYKPYAGKEKFFYILVGLEYAKGIEVTISQSGGTAFNVDAGDVPNQIIFSGGLGKEWTIKEDRVYIVTEGRFNLVFSDPVGFTFEGNAGLTFRF